MTKYLVFNFPYVFFNPTRPYLKGTFFNFEYKKRYSDYCIYTKEEGKKFLEEYTKAKEYCAYRVYNN